MMKDQKAFDPKSFEDKIFEKWTRQNAFSAKVNPNKKPYCIIMPPPNVTSAAHIGHAMDGTLQDILIRTKRMQGYETLWQPGTDHAAIATEYKLVEKLAKEGKTKESIGRERFEKEAWAWYDKYGDTIMSQFKKMGFSADYSRYKFTMDSTSTDAVLEAFIRLFNKGLVYRGKRMTNWCPNCGSAVSDEEVEYIEEKSHMWHIRYKFADNDGYIVVATTRPETLFGDVAVAVNPKDKRYKNLIGKYLIVPLVNRNIPIVADDYVDKDFGTGMVKITPAHDPNDLEVAKRHNLEIISVIDKFGVLTAQAGEFAGKKAIDMRDEIVEKLKGQKLIEKIEDYSHSVGHCYRCKQAIEPMITEQWFVKMSDLAKPAIECVKNGQLKIFAKKFEKNYLHWLENIQDWCISRQLWTGHRIPIYYCQSCGNIYTSKKPCNCPKCGSNNYVQDEDVLDTWFSSALWPFSTLGWPNDTPEMKYFYPTNVLVTGYDILLFWVTKMVYMGIECTGKVPFYNTILHGLVRDERGRKMSKSLGNGIDPLVVVNNYGADALRIALIKDMSLGMDSRFGETKLENARAFLNKLWNASKFVSLNADKFGYKELKPDQLNDIDKWILSKLNNLISNVTRNIDKYDIGVAISNIINFIWNDFCDWYIEFVKVDLKSDRATIVSSVLVNVLETVLKLLHPFAPFTTEFIYQEFCHEDLLMLADYPVFDNKLKYKKEELFIEKFIELIRNIRNYRNKIGIQQTEKIIITTSNQNFKLVEYLKKLTNAKDLIYEKNEKLEIISEIGMFGIKFEETKNEAKKKLYEEIEKVKHEISRSEGLLKNPGFIAKAPKTLVDAEKKKLEKNKELLNSMMGAKCE